MLELLQRLGIAGLVEQHRAEVVADPRLHEVVACRHRVVERPLMCVQVLPRLAVDRGEHGAALPRPGECRVVPAALGRLERLDAERLAAVGVARPPGARRPRRTEVGAFRVVELVAVRVLEEVLGPFGVAQVVERVAGAPGDGCGVAVTGPHHVCHAFPVVEGARRDGVRAELDDGVHQRLGVVVQLEEVAERRPLHVRHGHLPALPSWTQGRTHRESLAGNQPVFSANIASLQTRGTKKGAP
jgi:hypothetical protein